MESIGLLFLIAILPAIFFGDPRDWGKSESEKEYDRADLGGGLFAWFITQLGAVMTWWFVLIALWIAFIIIKAVWRLT